MIRQSGSIVCKTRFFSEIRGNIRKRKPLLPEEVSHSLREPRLSRAIEPPFRPIQRHSLGRKP